MFNVHMTSTTMDLLPLVCLCLLTWSGTMFVDGKDSRVIVAVNSVAILPCSLINENIEKKEFVWKKDGQKVVFHYNNGQHSNYQLIDQDNDFNGRVFHFQNKLKNGNASIKIKSTEISDSGRYTCTIQGKQVSFIKLSVGAAPEPSVSTLDQTENWARLQCKVRGASPQPHVQWQDSDGNTLTAEKSLVTRNREQYDVIVNVTVTKMDRYRCVSTQKEIYHQVWAETYVFMNGSVRPVGWMVGTTVLAFVLLVI